MRYLRSFTLIAALSCCPQSVKCDEPPPQGVDVETITADELWARVVKNNTVWLNPTTQNLSYITSSQPVEDDDRFPEITNRVWVSGDKARWEMDGARADINGRKMSYVLVVDGENEQYLKSPNPEMIRDVRRARDIRTMVQGTSWTSAVHVLASEGLPKQSKIVERRPVPDGHVIVLEADLGLARRKVGVGLYHAFYGSASGILGRVHVHIKTPGFIPIKEQYLAGEIPPCKQYPNGMKYDARDFSVKYDQAFMKIGNQFAPRTMQHVGPREWVLEFHFQNVDGHWLLEKSFNIQGGKRKLEMVVSKASTKPLDELLFDTAPDR